jgi:hypothetical protein
MTVAKDVDTRLDFNQAALSARKGYSPGKKKAGQGLQMASAQAGSSTERLRLDLRWLHDLILNGDGG